MSFRKLVFGLKYGTKSRFCAQVKEQYLAYSAELGLPLIHSGYISYFQIHIDMDCAPCPARIDCAPDWLNVDD
jgi:hypothetical protein